VATMLPLVATSLLGLRSADHPHATTTPNTRPPANIPTYRAVLPLLGAALGKATGVDDCGLVAGVGLLVLVAGVDHVKLGFLSLLDCCIVLY
jgi:hypothetical protein